MVDNSSSVTVLPVLPIGIRTSEAFNGAIEGTGLEGVTEVEEGREGTTTVEEGTEGPTEAAETLQKANKLRENASARVFVITVNLKV